MKANEGISKLTKLLKKPVFLASEARAVGVHPAQLSYYAKQGLIERVERGLYRGKNAPTQDVPFQWEDLVATLASVPRGVVCLVSALSIYELTEEIPRVHWIAIPHSATTPKKNRTKFIRVRNINLGKTQINLGSAKINIFDQERTVLDAFRYLGKETAIKALKMALTKKGKEKIDTKKLQKYAKELRVNITPYLLAVTT